MPNWVNNDVSITGSKLALDELFLFLSKAMVEGKGFCGAFRPMPKELSELTTGFTTIDGVRHNVWREVDGKSVALAQAEADALKEKYGTVSWHDWACANWGIKWDSSMHTDEFNLQRNPRSITFSMTCPWSLPEPIYQFIASNFGVKIRVNLSGEWDGPRAITY